MKCIQFPALLLVGSLNVEWELFFMSAECLSVIKWQLVKNSENVISIGRVDIFLETNRCNSVLKRKMVLIKFKR